MKRLTGFYLILVSIFFITFPSCQRDEFMPTPEGEAIPYIDTTQEWTHILQSNEKYQLFWLAWQRSKIEAFTQKFDSFTLFVPTNEAMIEAGYDINTIENLASQQLDSVIRLHVSPKQLYPDALSLQLGNLSCETLMDNGDFIEFSGEFTSRGKYRYRMYLTIEGNKIFINGKHIGDREAITVSKRATIFPIKQVLSKPRRDSHRWLFDDNRFSMYLAIRRHNDSLYNRLSGVANSYINSNTYDSRYVLDQNGKVSPSLNYLAATNYTWSTRTRVFTAIKRVYFTTIFVPTNEAFKSAGFHTVKDFLKLNDRAIPYPLFPSSFNRDVLSGYLPTDSILNNHYLGISDVRLRYSNGGRNADIARFPFAPMAFFSNDLKNEIIGDYIVSHYSNRGINYSLVNPLEFLSVENELLVRAKGSSFQAAKIVESDIETFNGIIHVVDQLLIPKGFKLR